MNKFKSRFNRFMIGRYGIDELNYALVVVVMCLLVINGWTDILLVYLTAIVMMIFYFYRPFSKNIAARRKENKWFLNLVSPVSRAYKKAKKQRSEKHHKVFECPRCHQFVRVPKGKGKVEITCPKCSQGFEKRT